MIMKKGIVTLTALILLSGLLALILLFDEQIFAFFRSQMSQRKYYVEQSLALQKISQQQQKHICQNLPLKFVFMTPLPLMIIISSNCR